MDHVWYGCEGKNVKEDVAFFGFYVFDGEYLWDFFYRRVLSVTQCAEEERAIREMLKAAKTVRMVGLHPREDDAPNLKDARIPERLKSVKKMLSSVFIRLQTQRNCKAFFEDDCDLPKNYWGGTTPL